MRKRHYMIGKKKIEAMEEWNCGYWIVHELFSGAFLN